MQVLPFRALVLHPACRRLKRPGGGRARSAGRARLRADVAVHRLEIRPDQQVARVPLIVGVPAGLEAAVGQNIVRAVHELRPVVVVQGREAVLVGGEPADEHVVPDLIPEHCVRGRRAGFDVEEAHPAPAVQRAMVVRFPDCVEHQVLLEHVAAREVVIDVDASSGRVVDDVCADRRASRQELRVPRDLLGPCSSAV